MKKRITVLATITMLLLAVTGYTSSFEASQRSKTAEPTSVSVQATSEQTSIQT